MIEKRLTDLDEIDGQKKERKKSKRVKNNFALSTRRHLDERK